MLNITLDVHFEFRENGKVDLWLVMTLTIMYIHVYTYTYTTTQQFMTRHFSLFAQNLQVWQSQGPAVSDGIQKARVRLSGWEIFGRLLRFSLHWCYLEAKFIFGKNHHLFCEITWVFPKAPSETNPAQRSQKVPAIDKPHDLPMNSGNSPRSVQCKFVQIRWVFFLWFLFLWEPSGLKRPAWLIDHVMISGMNF